MKLYSYVVARDYGFAPNPFYGYCTLATCKPVIRRTASVGDWLVGTGSRTRDLEGRLVYAMHVSEALTFSEYWNDPRFLKKRPNLHGSAKQAIGDNIYHRDRNGRWKQADSHHSFVGGRKNTANVDNDTQTDRVLIARRFVFFGGGGPIIPRALRSWKGYDICQTGRGHKNSFSDDFIFRAVTWITSLETGYVNEPSQFSDI